MLLSDMNNFERRISFQNILFGLEIEDLFATIFCGRKFSAEIYLTRSKFFWIKMAIFGQLIGEKDTTGIWVQLFLERLNFFETFAYFSRIPRAVFLNSGLGRNFAPTYATYRREAFKFRSHKTIRVFLVHRKYVVFNLISLLVVSECI
jgi:hypothetical protein